MNVVSDLIIDTSGVYGPQFDCPIDDDPHYNDLMSDIAEKKMKIFIMNDSLKSHNLKNRVNPAEMPYYRMFPMYLRYKLLSVSL